MKRVLLLSRLILAITSFDFCLAAIAQPAVSAVSVVVVDQSGASIPNVELVVHSATGTVTRFLSSNDGSFTIPTQPNPVVLDVASRGFMPIEMKDLFLNGSEPLHLVMTVGGGSRADVEGVPFAKIESSPTSDRLLQSASPSPVVQRSTVADAANASWEYGVQASGGVGLEDRTNFSFLNAGIHAGKVLTDNYGQGTLRANFEYGVEVIPFWQSYTPKFQRLNCPTGATVAAQCYGPTTTGGTYRGASIVPIILRINFTHGQRIMPWIQGAGGVLYTTRKYPGIGNLNVGDPTQTGPAADTSVWNFTPQGGIGMHYFVKPRRSLDFSANAVHISSASLGDKNPGVNDSVQFAVGYSWWK